MRTTADHTGPPLVADCTTFCVTHGPMRFSSNHTGSADYNHDSVSATGVLLVNLGTPEAPTAKAVRPYLAEFLGDPRVIESPRWLWLLILHGVILRIRPRRSAAAYAKIWNQHGSPLRVFSQALASGMQAELKSRRHEPIRVALAMRYGRPTVTETIARLQREGVRRLLVLPLYPQYSSTSTGSVLDAVATAIKGLRWPPELRIINDYHAAPGYIDALADSVHAYWQQHGRGEKLLLSFHGIPERYRQAGDPYFCQCQATARLLRERMGLTEHDMAVSFQSRTGRQQWLQPYTDHSMRKLGAEGVQRLDVLCPGFAVDCLETLEEVAMRSRDLFVAAGGSELHYIPALNDHARHVSALTELVLKHTQGWAESATGFDTDQVAAKLAAADARADALRDA